jgi:hypothetical protein
MRNRECSPSGFSRLPLLQEFSLSLAFLNRSELSERQAIVRTIHRFFGFDECGEIQNLKGASGQRHLGGMRENSVEAADAFDFAKAIENAQVGLQVQILQAGAQLIGQMERELLRRHAMAGVHPLKDRLQAKQILH